MTKYKGYYIDKVIFNSKKDIDEHIKKSNIEAIKRLEEMFENPRYSASEKMGIASMISDREYFLFKEYGIGEDELWNMIYA